MNFTVVLFQRQQFGNQPGIFNDVEPNVPFAGRAKSFVFDCPNIQNVLRVESRDARGTGSGNIDDFLIDNVVLVYKTPDAVTLPAVTGDLAAFIKTELLPSMTSVRGSGASANPADQHNEYVLPTASQLGSWRVVFRSLLAGAWADAHIQARTLSSTYNVVRFLDASTQRTYYVLMEGLPGQIPAAVSRPSSVTISDPADSSRRGWGTYIFDPVPRRALSLSAPHPHDDLGTAEQAADAYVWLQARSLLQMRFASGLPHDSICAPGNVPIARSRFIHVEQRRDARRARTDPTATPGRNRDVVMAAILATFTSGETGDPQLHAVVTS